VGSRPPVCFAKYAGVSATQPEVAETAVTQQYLSKYTPEIIEFQRPNGSWRRLA